MVTQCAVIKLICNLVSGSNLTFYRVIKSHQRSSTWRFWDPASPEVGPIHSPCLHISTDAEARVGRSHSPGNASHPCSLHSQALHGRPGPWETAQTLQMHVQQDKEARASLSGLLCKTVD